MKAIINKIKFWHWWFFKATALDKLNWDMITQGTAIRKMKDQQLDNAKRISPKMFYTPPKEGN